MNLNEVVERIRAEGHRCTNCDHLCLSPYGPRCGQANNRFVYNEIDDENACPQFLVMQKMQAEPRKFIQLLVVDTVVILGLCDDGTVWARGDGDWTPFGSAPQGEVTE